MNNYYSFFFQCNHNYYLWPCALKVMKYVNTFSLEIIQPWKMFSFPVYQQGFFPKKITWKKIVKYI